MASSLKDQLLQAGLVTEEQIVESEKKKKQKPTKRKLQSSRKKPNTAAKKPKRPESDLERFYKERAKTERQEKHDQDRLKKEQAALKKARNKKVKALIDKHQIPNEDGTIRYNFMIGKTIKYIFVNEEQQKQLFDGSLAVTFNLGKRCLIPVQTAKDIELVDPDKILVYNEVSSDESKEILTEEQPHEE
ncbi:MAG: Unknown protein [uncultured Thiotrichaceae bacterium]|uniref:DUF2058 domain-containing protein n=1 Tax=uncultured Thiotrichaceae bacterium TaxID=298394 RepID=A0A6S6U612_9GAMM|nr:MAG: Unknown protein [uncultured Thiotrichaceae bacterium]